jgi:hypothetical protein
MADMKLSLTLHGGCYSQSYAWDKDAYVHKVLYGIVLKIPCGKTFEAHVTKEVFDGVIRPRLEVTKGTLHVGEIKRLTQEQDKSVATLDVLETQYYLWLQFWPESTTPLIKAEVSYVDYWDVVVPFLKGDSWTRATEDEAE